MNNFRTAIALCVGSCIAATASLAQVSQVPASASAVDAANASVVQACVFAPVQDSTCPTEAEFGVFHKLPKDSEGIPLRFEKSRVVPLASNVLYGFAIRMNKESGKVRVLARIAGPKGARKIFLRDRAGSSGDGRSLSYDLTLDVLDGFIYGAMVTAPGDPIGPHSMLVWVEDWQPLAFEFEVVPTDSNSQ
ncbi:hypothetical protein [Variovorax sp. M-6]|uniref:hypothetical protein n=1 Tax=Variovorax sp. M-6 TaxID=3233041 RepID=UPI003F96C702